MIRFLSLSIACLLLASCGTTHADPQTAPQTKWRAETFVGGTPLHGIAGLSWGSDGSLYAAAVSGQMVSRIDPTTGAVETVVSPPDGESDDVALGPDGTLVWTAMLSGELRALRPDGTLTVLAKDIPWVNPVAFDRKGRLFAFVSGEVNQLFEFDLDGLKPPRAVTGKMGFLNSFDFGSDGHLYGPLWRDGGLVKINVETGEQTLLVSGLDYPAAVELDSQGNLISVEFYLGHVRRTDPETGHSTIIAKLDPPRDNLAVGPDDMIYVSDTARSDVTVLKPDGTVVGRLTGGEFSLIGGVDVVTINNQEMLVVADPMGHRFIDLRDGSVMRPPLNNDFGNGTNIAASDTVMALTDIRTGRAHIIDLETRTLLFDRSGFDAPAGIAILPDGDILIVEYGTGSLIRWDGLETKVVANGLYGPVGLVLDSERTVLVSEHGAGRLTRIDLKTGQTSVAFDGLDQPEGLAMRPDGRVVVAETGASRVIALDLDDSVMEVLAKGLEFGSLFSRTPQDVGMPAGVAIGSDGVVYVSVDGRNALVKITPVGG